MVRRIFVAVLVVGLVVAGYAGYWLFTEDPHHDPPAQEQAGVVGASDDGWQRLAFRDFRLEVPPDWNRLETSQCDAHTEHWGPPGVEPCGAGAGVWFYASATYDPVDGPGVRRIDATDDLPDGGWAGYVIWHQDVVYVQELDPELVRRILRSVAEPVVA